VWTIRGSRYCGTITARSEDYVQVVLAFIDELLRGPRERLQRSARTAQVHVVLAEATPELRIIEATMAAHSSAARILVFDIEGFKNS